MKQLHQEKLLKAGSEASKVVNFIVYEGKVTSLLPYLILNLVWLLIAGKRTTCLYRLFFLSEQTVDFPRDINPRVIFYLNDGSGICLLQRDIFLVQQFFDYK